MISSDFPVVVTIATAEYTGTFMNQKIERTYSKYGINNSYNCSVILSKTELSEAPEIGTKVTIEEVDYRVIGADPNHAGFIVDLEKVRKR